MRSHCFAESIEQARGIQTELAKRLILSGEVYPEIVAGADCSYSRARNFMYSSVVVYHLLRGEVIEVKWSREEVKFPYVPGYLSFREGPCLLDAISKLKIKPEVLIFDGQGIAHPRRMGIASHLGILLEIPSIGCAKSRLYGEGKMPGWRKGDFEFIFDEDEVIGAVLRTKANVQPVFVSAGHLMGLESAIRIVLDSVKGFRIPEPLRLAHIFANRMRKEDEG